jgi:hypothetical protein
MRDCKVTEINQFDDSCTNFAIVLDCDYVTFEVTIKKMKKNALGDEIDFIKKNNARELTKLLKR